MTFLQDENHLGDLTSRRLLNSTFEDNYFDHSGSSFQESWKNPTDATSIELLNRIVSRDLMVCTLKYFVKKRYASNNDLPFVCRRFQKTGFVSRLVMLTARNVLIFSLWIGFFLLEKKVMTQSGDERVFYYNSKAKRFSNIQEVLEYFNKRGQTIRPELFNFQPTKQN